MLRILIKTTILIENEYKYFMTDTFHDWGSAADDPDFSIDLTWFTATIRTPEI